MPKSLIIVESPTKAKTLSRFLGSDYEVRSSFGHIRDLPKSELGVDVEHGFEPHYVTPLKAKSTLADLKKAATKNKEVILATDEDREGESIAWHLAEALGLDPKDTKRIVFHEITKHAIDMALKNPRHIDMHLVDAQQGRRVLDRLVGYELSPFLWKKVARGLSAGRVQSVAVRIIVDREREIEAFVAVEYWTIGALLQTPREESFEATLWAKKGEALEKLAIKNQKEAEEIVETLSNAAWHVQDITKKNARRLPSPPFTTSALVQEASRRLHFSSRMTMRVAQQLYERGLCLTGDTLVVTTKGEILKMQDLEKISGAKLVGIDETTLRQEPAEVEKFWKIRAPQEMFRIETNMHDSITATADHPFLVIEKGRPQWKKAAQLCVDDYVAAPEYIAVARQKKPSTIIDFIQDFPAEVKERVRFECGRGFPHGAPSSQKHGKAVSATTLLKLLSAKTTHLEEIERFYRGVYVTTKSGRKGSAVLQKIPFSLTPDLAYLLGFITGDGHLDSRINFCIKARRPSLERLRGVIERVLQCPYPWLRPSRVQYRLQSTFLYQLLQHFGVPKGNKSTIIDIPNLILRQPDNIVQGYIAGLWDSDGCITKSWRNSMRISYSSRSKIFIEKLRLVLKTFGINSAQHFDSRTNVHWILLTAQGVLRFKEYIAPYLVIKKDAWENIWDRHGSLYETRLTSRDRGIPALNPLIEELLAAHEMPKQTISATVGVDMFNYFGKIKSRHTRNPFFSKALLMKLSGAVDTPDKLLYSLAHTPLVWKKIKSVERTAFKEKFVYDVTTSTNTFIANGLVSHNCTYHRTDSVNLSGEFHTQARPFIENGFGQDYYQARAYKTKSRLAQEAHEAIRPTDVTKQSLVGESDARLAKLYDLIWRRAVASQMKDALFEATTADIAASADAKDAASDYTFRATGSVMRFDGFLKVWPAKIGETLLPELIKHDALKLLQLTPAQHFTEPPPRYTEATLVKTLEAHDIGRPSTYSPTISTIQDRRYVEKERGSFHPTDIGKTVTDLMKEHFPEIVDVDFTATMETNLDRIAQGKSEWVPIIKTFYHPFKKTLTKKYEEVSKSDITTEATDETCPECGKPLVLRLGRFGKFYSCSGYPKCAYKRSAASGNTGENGAAASAAPEKTDEPCPNCGNPLVIRSGRFGKFYGCSTYPKCKFTRNTAGPLGIKCPECGEGDVVEKQARTKKGRRPFWGCSRYPACKYATWHKPGTEKSDGESTATPPKNKRTKTKGQKSNDQ